jgi:hypothetical protein
MRHRTVESRMPRAAHRRSSLIRLQRLLLAALAAGLVASAPVYAKVTTVKLLQVWSGRVPLGVQPPLQSSLATQADLAHVWAQCHVKGTVPAIDFDKRLLLVAVRRGSVVTFQSMQVDKGNLRTNVVVTPDMPAYMTCALALVDRAGVAKVNGAPIGK